MRVELRILSASNVQVHVATKVKLKYFDSAKGSSCLLTHVFIGTLQII